MYTSMYVCIYACYTISNNDKMNLIIIGMLHYKPNSISLNRVAVFPISTAFEKHCRLIGSIHFLLLPIL